MKVKIACVYVCVRVRARVCVRARSYLGPIQGARKSFRQSRPEDFARANRKTPAAGLHVCGCGFDLSGKILFQPRVVTIF